MANEDEVPCCASSSCCCCCISIATNTIISLILFVCFASLLVWAMLLSNAVKFQVHDAELRRFDFDLGNSNNNNNLHYNLSLNFSIRNSNSHMGIHYDKFEAAVYYSDQRLASVSVPSFYQGHKSTAVVETLFQGQNLVSLGGQKFEDDKKLGVYGIDVNLRIKSRVLFLHLITWPMKPIIRCHLKLPLHSSNSVGGFDFQSTKCHLHF